MLILVFISVWRMSAVSSVSLAHVLKRILILLALQILALVLGLALPLLIACIFDSFGSSLTYFSSLSLLIGLYVCPSLIGMSLPITIYYQLNRKVSVHVDELNSSKRLNFIPSRTSYLSLTTCNWLCIVGPSFWLFWL